MSAMEEEKGKKERPKSKDIRRYYCDYCGICRSKKSLILSHISTQHKKEADEERVDGNGDIKEVKSNICEECGARFNKPAYLKQHMLSHSLERSFQCSVDDCNASYRRKDHLNRHLLQHQGKLFMCPIENCNIEFTLQGNMKRHVKECHHKGSTSKSTDSGDGSTSTSADSGDGSTSTSADSGDGSTSTSADSVEGSTSMSADSGEGSTSTSADSGEGSTSTSADSGEGSTSTSADSGEGSTSTSADSGEGSTSTSTDCGGQKQYTCKEIGCGKVFKYASKLRQHNCGGQKQYTCKEIGCGKVFKYASKLRRHEDSHVKLDSVEAFCSEPGCMKYFTNKQCLEDHIRLCHQYIPCHICGSMQLKKNIKRHFRTHESRDSAERIKCQFKGCLLSFSTKSNLQQHVKAVHYEIKPFACSIFGCGMRFAYKHVRDNHEKSGHHVYASGDFVESDEQFRSRERGGRKRKCPTVEMLVRKRVTPPSPTGSYHLHED